MAINLKTPGVYIEEVSKFPPSVAQVETAIPAFIGYTYMAKRKVTSDLNMIPTRISSLLEYETFFGKADINTVTLEINDELSLATLTSRNFTLTTTKQSPFLMYYNMQLYFANGGGPCYIVSVGEYGLSSGAKTTVKNTELKSGLDVLEKVDEPTLLVFPDAINISGTIATKPDNFYNLYADALAQCNKLQDRFAIIDILKSADKSGITEMRNKLASPSLKYGAAYFPHVRSIINYAFDTTGIVVTHNTSTTDPALVAAAAQAQIDADVAQANADDLRAFADANPADAPAEAAAVAAEAAAVAANAAATAAATAADPVVALGTHNTKNLSELETVESALYNDALAKLLALKVTLAPSSAIAGIYARVDSSRGVWKAPANEPMAYISEPVIKLTNAEQEDMNIDATAGKSVNAIRFFRGKGNLVWGGRTLAGNDNEWRYISVRRFFNMAEESIKKASERYVFESNDANTWIQIKVMIENFLTLQWRNGALQGAKTSEAFYVKVGLGETMTYDDVLNGRLIVEIGMSVVRPAEFIVLKFSHKMLEV